MSNLQVQSSFKEKDIYSRLLRCSAARGAIFGLSLGSPTKIKSFIFTENSLKVENKKNTCLISLSHFISSHFAQICQNVGLYENWIEKVTKIDIKKAFKNMGLCLYTYWCVNIRVMRILRKYTHIA